MNLKKNFFEQLFTLRTSLVKSLLIYLAVFAALIPFSASIYDFFSEPLLQELLNFNGSMISTKLSATFMIPLKITAFTAFIIAYPLIFYNIWTFVSPGLFYYFFRKSSRNGEEMGEPWSPKTSFS